jgi:hypothetical protein
MTMKELKAFDQLSADLSLMVTPVKALTVKDADSCAKAVAARREVKSWEKKIEEKRKELVAPLNEQVKRINEYAKLIANPIGEATAHIDSQLREWERILEAQRQIELKRAHAEKMRMEEETRKKIAEQAEEAAALAMFEVAEKADEVLAKAEAEAIRIEYQAHKLHNDTVKEIKSNKVAGSRRVWKFEITDPTQVPSVFLIVNEQAIRAAVNAGTREIPGVRIFEDIIFSSRNG